MGVVFEFRYNCLHCFYISWWTWKLNRTATDSATNVSKRNLLLRISVNLPLNSKDQRYHRRSNCISCRWYNYKRNEPSTQSIIFRPTHIRWTRVKTFIWKRCKWVYNRKLWVQFFRLEPAAKWNFELAYLWNITNLHSSQWDRKFNMQRGYLQQNFCFYCNVWCTSQLNQSMQDPRISVTFDSWLGTIIFSRQRYFGCAFTSKRNSNHRKLQRY